MSQAALRRDELVVLQQAHPGVGNADRYAGYWYQANDDTLELPGGDGAARLADVPLSLTSRLGGAAIAPLLNATLHDIDAISRAISEVAHGADLLFTCPMVGDPVVSIIDLHVGDGTRA